MNYSFRELIGPVREVDFFEQHYQKNILHVEHNNCDFYNELLTYGEVIDFLNRKDLVYPRIRVVKNSSELAPGHFTRNINMGERKPSFSNLIVPRLLAKNYVDYGNSIIVFQAQDALEKMQGFTHLLQNYFGCMVSCNIYITPPNSIGFSPHFDVHDVLILQVSGKKHWKIHKETRYLPYDETQDFNVEEIVTNADYVFNQELVQGDLLYVPRGHVHEVCTNDSSSIHITIGLKVNRGKDLINRILSNEEDMSFLRKAIPSSHFEADQIEHYKESLKNHITQLIDKHLAEELTNMTKHYKEEPYYPRDMKKMHKLFKDNR